MPPRPSSLKMTQLPSRSPIIVIGPYEARKGAWIPGISIPQSQIESYSWEEDKCMKTALLLIAHGSRQSEANADLQFLATELRRRGEYDFVEPAYLELAQPD